LLEAPHFKNIETTLLKWGASVWYNHAHETCEPISDGWICLPRLFLRQEAEELKKGASIKVRVVE
jgi:hypothetical protein